MTSPLLNVSWDQCLLAPAGVVERLFSDGPKSIAEPVVTYAVCGGREAQGNDDGVGMKDGVTAGAGINAQG